MEANQKEIERIGNIILRMNSEEFVELFNYFIEESMYVGEDAFVYSRNDKEEIKKTFYALREFIFSMEKFMPYFVYSHGNLIPMDINDLKLYYYEEMAKRMAEWSDLYFKWIK